MQLGTLSLGDHMLDPDTGRRVTTQDRLGAMVRMGVHGEELGFDYMAVGEHHFSDYIVSSPLVMLSAIAARTSHIRLSTAVTLLPLLDPVRVAEDFATLDQLSGGRAELVLGRGISSDGYAEFGVEQDRSREVVEEKLSLLQRIWSEQAPLTWQGTSRPPLTDVLVRPRSLQASPRVWMGTGMSEESVRWTAGLGLPLMLPSIFKRAEEWHDQVRLYRELMCANGHADRALVGACSHVHLARESQTARASWKPYLVQYAEWANKLRGVNVEIDYDRLVNGPAICGSPAEVTERLQSIDESLRPDLHMSVFDIGGLPEAEVMANMELFACDVMPHLRVAHRGIH